MHESIESEMFVLDDVNCFVKEETRETRFGEVSLCPRDQDSIEKSDASHLREIKWGRYALRGRGVGSGRFAQFGAAFLKKEKKRDNHLPAPVTSAPRQNGQKGKIRHEEKVSFSIRLL
jgi:hypothetical protein